MWGGGGRGEGVVSSLLYISIAYYMQKGGWVGKIAYILNGRPPCVYNLNVNTVPEPTGDNPTLHTDFKQDVSNKLR